MIDDDIPIPKPHGKSGQTDPQGWAGMASKMDCGHSIMVSTEYAKESLRQAIYRQGGGVAVRKIHGEGWRVWRVDPAQNQPPAKESFS